MNPIYKKLMEQHGGSIPFHVLGGVKKSNKTIKRNKKPNKHKTKRRSKKLNTQKYSAGTIIRHKGQLMKLSPTKQWIIIK